MRAATASSTRQAAATGSSGCASASRPSAGGSRPGEARRLGASGFLLKELPPEELVDAVRVVASGDAVLRPSVTRKVVEAFAAGRAEVAPPPDPALGELTDRELEVFKLLAAAKSNA